MPSSCVFLYDHPDAVYYSGDVLNGKIILTTENVKNVGGIYITIRGVAKVRWEEDKTGRYDTGTTEYKGDRKCLHSETLVVGCIDLPVGTHEYTFTTPLPPQIPSSISAEHGNITYEVELKLDRPMHSDNVYTNCFTVIHSLNLNLDPSYLQPIFDTEKKYICCWCCGSGPINSEIRTEFGGYAPGQKLNFTVTLDNESNRDIEGCSVKLIQKHSFHSDLPKHKVKAVKNVIARVGLNGVQKFCKKSLGGNFIIPTLPPSTFESDDIIKTSYYLRAKIKTGNFSCNVILQAAFTIGTVPLFNCGTNSDNVVTVQPKVPFDMPPQYESFDPPSFEEATGMRMTANSLDSNTQEQLR